MHVRVKLSVWYNVGVNCCGLVFVPGGLGVWTCVSMQPLGTVCLRVCTCGRGWLQTQACGFHMHRAWVIWRKSWLPHAALETQVSVQVPALCLTGWVT